MDDDAPVAVTAAPGALAPGQRLVRRVPATISVACGVLWFGVVGACVPAAIALMAAVQGIPDDPSTLLLLPLALALLGLVVVQAFTTTRLSRGSRPWWFAALALLGVQLVAFVLDVARTYQRPTQFLIPALLLAGLACLLTPSARRFVRPLPPA